MAGFSVSLGQCGFCGAAAGRRSRLVGDPTRRERICRSCVTRLVKPPRELPRLYDLACLVPASRPPDVPEIPEDGSEQFTAGQVLRKFRSRVEEVIDPKDYVARRELGVAYFEMGLIDEATAEFQRAAEDPALRAECLGLIGVCFRVRGDLDRAIESITQAIKHPDSTDRQKAAFYYELGVSLQSAGDSYKAAKAFSQAWQHDPAFPLRRPPLSEDEWDLQSAREAFAGGESRDAYRTTRNHDPLREMLAGAAALEASLRADPQHPAVRFTLARVCVTLGRSLSAAHHYLLLGLDLAKEGDTEKANAAFERCIELGVPSTLVAAHRALEKLRDESTGGFTAYEAATTADDPALQPFVCSFCDARPDFSRPPAKSDAATICCACLQQAYALFTSERRD